MASEAGDLKAILASAGMLKNFALAMSLTTLAADILATAKGELGDEFPSYDRCKSEYPSLFTNLDLAGPAAAQSANMPAEQENLAFQERSEDKDYDRIAARKNLQTTSFGALATKKTDLFNGELAQ